MKPCVMQTLFESITTTSTRYFPGGHLGRADDAAQLVPT
jgi:hypothetical protein